MRSRTDVRVVVTKMDSLRAERSLRLGEALPDDFRDRLTATIEAHGRVPAGGVLLTRFGSVAPSVAWCEKTLARMDRTTGDAA